MSCGRSAWRREGSRKT